MSREMLVLEVCSLSSLFLKLQSLDGQSFSSSGFFFRFKVSQHHHHHYYYQSIMMTNSEQIRDDISFV